MDTWHDPSHAALADGNPRVKHELHDVFGTPSAAFHTGVDELAAPEEQPRWHARVAFGRSDAGLESIGLAGEPASLWFYDGTTWQGTDAVLSGDQGWVDFDGPTTEVGLVERTLVLEADATCGRQVSVRLAADAPVVITDIDETLTIADAEFYQQVNDADYVPVARAGGPELMHAWAEQGVQPIYMTARPHVARAETRTWLEDLGFPPGPLITADGLVFGEATADYKALWVARVVDELGWDVLAAYGNAPTDIDAYLTRVPAERVFIIGPHAGEQGTVAVDVDWLEHLAEVRDR